jgi:hypothetical protein
MMKHYFRAFIFIAALSLAEWGHAFSISDLKKDTMVRQDQAQDIVENAVLEEKLPDLEHALQDYSQNFSNVDVARAFFQAGVKFYNKGYKNLSLPAFIRGAGVFGDSPYRADCSWYAARVLYLQNDRLSALFQVNRAITRLNKLGGDISNRAFTLDDAQKLKRRLRWDYLSRYEGLPDDSISDIEFDGDDVWISMWTGGVARYTRSSRTVTLFNPGNSGLISIHTRACEVLKNRVWVATYEGLCSYSKKSGNWETVREIGDVSVKKLRLIDGCLYAATLGKGLFRMEEPSEAWLPVFTASSNVTDVTDFGGKLFVAALDSGVWMQDGNKFREVLSNTPAKTLRVVRDELWVGTHGMGIIKLAQDGTVKGVLMSHDGIGSDYVETIESQSGKVLIGTLGGGAAIYDTEDGTFKRMTILDGLPSNDVVRIAFEHDRVWFGTLSGGVGIMLTEGLSDL